jgi:hypothetical protein
MSVTRPILESERMSPTVGIGLDSPGGTPCANSTDARAVGWYSAGAHGQQLESALTWRVTARLPGATERRERPS